MTELLLELVPSTLTGDRRAQVLYVVALAVLAAGTLLCAAAVRFVRLDVTAVALTGAGAAAWLLANGPAEGSTLLVVLPGNGVTVADLAVLPAAFLVLLLSTRRLRGR